MANAPLDGQTSAAIDSAWQKLLIDGGCPNPPALMSLASALNNVYNQIGLANTATLSGAAAGSTPSLAITGSDTNVGLAITLKGSGSVLIGSGANSVSLAPPAGGSIAASAITSAPGASWTSGNALVMQFGATGVDPRIIVSGFDTNPNFVLQGQGTGALIWKNAGGTQEWKVDASGNMSWLGNLVGTRTAHSATGNIAATEFIVGQTTTASAFTLTLPTGTQGQVIIVKDESGAAVTNHITVNPPATGHIDGAASASIATNYGVLRLYCGSTDGLTWFTF